MTDLIGTFNQGFKKGLFFWLRSDTDYMILQFFWLNFWPRSVEPFRFDQDLFYVVYHRLSFKGIKTGLAFLCLEKKIIFMKNFEKIRNFNCLNCDNSKSFLTISNPKTVLKSMAHELSFNILFGAKIKILEWRILIGRKGYLRFRYKCIVSEISKSWNTLSQKSINCWL